ncbi:MAG: hypothetical protein IJ357_03210 [Oscillospiraceae bacterium]|nr:hypothetical protein [Oscillospiraceae bacterium]
MSSDRIMLLFSIVERGKGKQLMETLSAWQIALHFQSVGFGTAPSEMMDIFGLGSKDKDIIYSFAPETPVRALMADFSQNVGSTSQYGGLLIVMKLNAINRLAAEILTHDIAAGDERGAEEPMKNEHKHNLVLINVNHGYADQVMQVAKKAGATGGTIVRGRLAESDGLRELAQMDIQDEREIIFILAPENASRQIMADVNNAFGMRSEAAGMICALPIEKAFKI